MEILSESSEEIVSEPMELFFHNKELGPVIADFAMETMAKNLKLKANKITQKNYFIGYFTCEQNGRNKEEIKSKFRRGLEMMRLFIKDKDDILSEPKPCKNIPLHMIDLKLLSLFE
jgi:hypothetical protein